MREHRRAPKISDQNQGFHGGLSFRRRVLGPWKHREVFAGIATYAGGPSDRAIGASNSRDQPSLLMSGLFVEVVGIDQILPQGLLEKTETDMLRSAAARSIASLVSVGTSIESSIGLLVMRP